MATKKAKKSAKQLRNAKKVLAKKPLSRPSHFPPDPC